MSQNQDSGQAGARTVVIDLAVAAIIFALGALVAWDSHRLGSGWSTDGPQTGYFPFYIGLITCICGAAVFVQGLLKLGTDQRVFVTPGQFKQVLVILVPSTVYVLGVQFIGIYVSSAIFIALFMRIAGKYSWLRGTVVGLGVSVSAFVMFEIWFKIPLPKGPLENLLGY
jgi:putative tricarboxylic transport membrane protein